MLEMGVIHPANNKIGQIISTILLREKKEEDQYRLIVNLKPLNAAIPYEKLKMETLKNAQETLQEGDWLVKIDLKKHTMQSISQKKAES